MVLSHVIRWIVCTRPRVVRPNRLPAWPFVSFTAFIVSVCYDSVCRETSIVADTESSNYADRQLHAHFQQLDHRYIMHTHIISFGAY